MHTNKLASEVLQILDVQKWCYAIIKFYLRLNIVQKLCMNSDYEHDQRIGLVIKIPGKFTSTIDKHTQNTTIITQTTN
jgi:hypothetical protein